MKHTIITLTFLVTAGCGHLSQAQSETSGPDMGWLEGCWQHSDVGTRETWVVGHDDLLFGHAVTLKEDELQAFEDLRIQPSVSGALIYVASPNGSTPVVFGATSFSERSIEFANAAHDFPQRIRYERTAATLTATISLADGSNSISFAMSPCSHDGLN